MNKNRTVQPLSENTRKAIIIAAIIVVAVVILSISLALILRPAILSPDDQNTPGTGSSNLKIPNGDFAYATENTAYPRTAQNWVKYGYKKRTTSNTHGFETISNNDKAVMGIVNVSTNEDEDEETWLKSVQANLEGEGLTVRNPGVHDRDENDDESVSQDDNNFVYMIATKEATVASIFSDAVSVASGASVKISMWINTEQLEEGEAVIMIQKSSTSALSDNWYAYNFHIGQKDGWQQYDFYVFNREASTKYIRICIGIGNVYSGEKAGDAADDENFTLADANEPIKGKGTIFVDDITYEVKTANDYRVVVDDKENVIPAHSYKVIENEDIVDESKYLGLTSESSKQPGYYTDAETYATAAGGYSPFTDRDDFYKTANGKQEPSGFTIFKLEHDGTEPDSPIALRLDASTLTNANTHKGINVSSSLWLKDHHHISFWVRVEQINKVAYASVYIQKWNDTDGKWEDINSSSSWKIINTSQEIDEDANCGWLKYDIYLKPSAQEEQISILFTLGKKDNYNEVDRKNKLYPNGKLYVTSPAYEAISYSDYNSASSGGYVKKIDLVGASASSGITNGTFSSLDSTGRQPAGWTQAFGGDNSIYRDGLGNLGGLTDDQRLASVIKDSGTLQSYDGAVTRKSTGTNLDDAQRNVLRIANGTDTSFGYYSSDITLYSKTAYVISVLFKTESDSLDPFIYLLNTDSTLARKDREIMSITSKEQSKHDIDARLLGYDWNNSELGNGWTRYYMIVVTGAENMTVRLALFNGSIDGSKTQSGTIYYDRVDMQTIGTYSLVKDEDAEEGSEEAKYYKVEWTDFEYVEDNEENIEMYGENFGELLTKTVSEEDETLLLTSWGIDVTQPTEEEWTEMKTIPEDEDGDDGHDHDHDEGGEVDLGLLFSVISSIALVAALLVVFVVRVYKNKRHTKVA